MQPYFTIKKETTFNVLKSYIEEHYGYENASISARAYEGCYDPRGSEPGRVEFDVRAKKDLGLGIGISDITFVLGEKEASAVITQKLAEQGVEVAKTEFDRSMGDYYDRGYNFTGTKIYVKTLEDMKSLGKAPKVKTK